MPLLDHVYPGAVEERSEPRVLVTGNIPTYATPGDAGCDLVSTQALTLTPGERALVATGTYLALPEGYVALVMPRSGLAWNHGIGLVNSPGVIDSGYRGEIKVILINHDRTESYDICPGDRIAQLVISPVSQAQFHPVDKLPESHRQDGGFGSTGTRA
jgi:dUTP pyrophosphatase